MKFKLRDYRILIVDDDLDTLELFREFLSDNFNVDTVSSAERALQQLSQKEYHLVITDLVMPGIDGLQLIEEIKSKWEKISILVISGRATVRTAVDAMKAGAEELILKPVTDFDLVLLQVKRSLHKKWLQSENQRLKRLLINQKHRILGNSKQIQLLLQKIKKISPLETTILLTGETGVGKSFFAEVIHEESRRSEQKFVSINCGALTESLLESTLFGHKRGAFTGAVRSKRGLFEEANHGTLFLDEISETSNAFQVKLLNAIESGKIRPVGEEREINVDVRLIFATNRNLREEVEKGKFRKDLFFRINVVNLEIPALRERKEDIILMATAFLLEFCQKHGLGKLHFAPKSRELLQQHDWEGNIRELRNVVEHSAVMSESQEIIPANLPGYLNKMNTVFYDVQDLSLNYREAKERFERSYFNNLLHKTLGNITESARESGLARQCIYRKMESLGIDPRKHRRV